MNNKAENVVTIIIAVIVAVSSMMLAEPPTATAQPDTEYVNEPGVPNFDLYAWEVGDDNADGVITEDEYGWNCATMGNMICGPSIDPAAWDLGAYVGGYN